MGLTHRCANREDRRLAASRRKDRNPLFAPGSPRLRTPEPAPRRAGALGPSGVPYAVASSIGSTIRPMDFQSERDLMVRELRRMGIRDERVLAAMAKVPRERFVREEDQDVAYGDHALGIAEGQTISQPFVVARMTELLQVEPTHHVLEVGTGSGYQAAVLAELAHDVVTVERHAVLADQASALLAELGYESVKVVAGDASIGYPPDAPYDRILVTAASPGIAPELVRQCAPDGLIVAPVGDQEMQHLVVRYPDGRETRHGAVKFVPLRGRAGFR